MATLQHEVQQMELKVSEIQQSDPADIRVRDITQRQLQRLLCGLAFEAPQATELMDDTAPQVACPECGLHFKSLKQMRQRRAQTHKIRVRSAVLRHLSSTQPFMPLEDFHNVQDANTSSKLGQLLSTMCKVIAALARF